MEASENPGLSGEGSGGVLHRVDPQRVTTLLRGDSSARGYARLELMLGSVLPRLTETPKPQAG
jgi:hypothetical protein